MGVRNGHDTFPWGIHAHAKDACNGNQQHDSHHSKK